MLVGNLHRLPGLHINLVRCLQTNKLDVYKKCYRILDLAEDADQETVRQTYIELVKKLHPDSGTLSASAEKFQEIDEAFKILQEKFAKNRNGIEDEEIQVFKINHSTPQHRKYLSYDGIGTGTPAKRQKEYYQAKTIKAQEHVFNHRIDKTYTDEASLMKIDSRTQSKKIGYGIHRIAEDLIEEAISKGDFDDLSCAGKPLPSRIENPYLDFTTQKINKILLDNGYTPEWISLQREIRKETQNLKDKLSMERSYYREFPLTYNEEKDWNKFVSSFQNEVKHINKMIDKYNLIVPIFNNQFFRIELNKMAEQILKDVKIERVVRPTNERKHEITKKKNPSFLHFLVSLFLKKI